MPLNSKLVRVAGYAFLLITDLYPPFRLAS
jgi:hypothetical protein